MFDDKFDCIAAMEADILGLEAEVKQLKWLLKCKDDPKLCPCGGQMGGMNYYSHATNCKEICPNGKDYGLY